MRLRKSMKFCWKKFRHFVVAYFALGVAATATHGTIVFMAVEDMVAEESAPVAISDSPTAPTEPVPPIEEVPTPAEEITTEEPLTDTADTSNIADNNETPVAEPATDESAAITAPETDAAVIEDAAPASDEPVDEPAAPDQDTSSTPAAPASEEGMAPDETTNSSEVTSTEEPADTNAPSESETPVESEPEIEPIAQLPETDPVDTWPEVRLDNDTFAVEQVSPYSEVRSTLEAVTPMLDWIYTLRADARYTDIATAKGQLLIDTQEVIEALEMNGTDARINTNFCDLDADLAQLTTLLAPNSDTTQPEVDAQNVQIINDIRSAVIQVRETWVTTSGSSYQCSN